MKTLRTIAAVVTALAFAGYAPITQTAEAQDKPDVSLGGASTPQQAPISLVGRWGDNGDCTKDITFNADGSFRSYTGGIGTWRLDGDVVTLSGSGGTFTVRVEVINGSQLTVYNGDGSVGTSQRC